MMPPGKPQSPLHGALIFAVGGLRAAPVRIAHGATQKPLPSSPQRQNRPGEMKGNYRGYRSDYRYDSARPCRPGGGLSGPRRAGITSSLPARIVSRRLNKELQQGPFLCGRSAPTVADLSAYGAILPGFELGLTGGGAMLKRPSILQWAKRVHATLDPSLPLVPDSVRVRTFS